MDNNINTFQNPSLSGINDGVDNTNESASTLKEINEKISVVEDIDKKLDVIISLIEEQVKKTAEVTDVKEEPVQEEPTFEVPNDLIKEEPAVNPEISTDIPTLTEEPVKDTFEPEINLNEIKIPEELNEVTNAEPSIEEPVQEEVQEVKVEPELQVSGEAIDTAVPTEPLNDIPKMDEPVAIEPKVEEPVQETAPSDIIDMSTILSNVETSTLNNEVEQPVVPTVEPEINLTPDVKIENNGEEAVPASIMPEQPQMAAPAPEVAPQAVTPAPVTPVQEVPAPAQVAPATPVQEVPAPTPAPAPETPVVQNSEKDNIEVLNINIPGDVKTESGKQRSDVKTEAEQTNLINYKSNNSQNINAQPMTLKNVI